MKDVIDIHGQDYTTVSKRVRDFRSKYGDAWGVHTSIHDINDQHVIFRAEIVSSDGTMIATGHAIERWASSKINKEHALEVAETSAIGRALAALGMGGDGAYASADEVISAMRSGGDADNWQEVAEPHILDAMAELSNVLGNKYKAQEIIDRCAMHSSDGKKSWREMTRDEAKVFLANLKKTIETNKEASE